AIPSGPEHGINFAETSLVVDGDAITAYVRSAIECVFTAESRDGGRTWDRLRPSNLPMRSSKTSAGRLSTGQRYLALNLVDPLLGDRDVLALAVSAPGDPHLRKLVPLRRGPSPAPRLSGYCKAPQWSYPSVEEYAGNVYVTYSVTKEDCCLSILPLEELRV
ncbi:MAG: exo-alpha-sialidase, partial [Armatimonadota bacterium]